MNDLTFPIVTRGGIREMTEAQAEQYRRSQLSEIERNIEDIQRDIEIIKKRLP